MPVILLIGDDQTLQQTRAAVLRTIGAETVLADTRSAMAAQSQRLFDLLLLCHSVPEEVAAGIVRAFRSHTAFTPILRIAHLSTWDSSEEDGFESVTSGEPARLLKRTAELLGIRRSQCSVAA
ncbi:MAG TPA: response regulator [Acidobacteriaceae bacterium]|nr:response regulator [Acidobacteriaceae bacterium]